MDRIDLAHALSRFDDHWSPKIIAALNGQEVKLAKFQGAFDWHSHADEDELFLVLDGSFRMDFRDRTVELQEGQMIVVPRGVEIDCARFPRVGRTVRGLQGLRANIGARC